MLRPATRASTGTRNSSIIKTDTTPVLTFAFMAIRSKNRRKTQSRAAKRRSALRAKERAHGPSLAGPLPRDTTFRRPRKAARAALSAPEQISRRRNNRVSTRFKSHGRSVTNLGGGFSRPSLTLTLSEPQPRIEIADRPLPAKATPDVVSPNARGAPQAERSERRRKGLTRFV